MTNPQCPQCQLELAPLEKHPHGGHCASCGVNYHGVAYCPSCDQPVEVLKACGAVDYFCPGCNQLQSKRQIIFKLEALEI